MKIKLKYGCNPYQLPAHLEVPDGEFVVLNGAPSFINMLDALGAWQLAKELKGATGKAAAASFKHTSPAGAALAGYLTPEYRRSQFLDGRELSAVASAYVRARGGDRMSSFGDLAAVSEIVDVSLANFLKEEVSDGIIASGYEPAALEILRSKRQGAYLVLQIGENYSPPEFESRQIFGFALEQARNGARISAELFRNVVTSRKAVPAAALESLIVATITLKYAQSNSVCIAFDGQVIGIGAGQQSRIHCTRLASDKADKWFLQQHPQTLDLDFVPNVKKPEKTNVVDQFLLREGLSASELDQMLGALARPPLPLSGTDREEWIRTFAGVCLSSDAYIPFRDNIDRASRSSVRFVAQAGGAMRDSEVTQAANEHDMVMMHTGLRLFTH